MSDRYLDCCLRPLWKFYTCPSFDFGSFFGGFVSGMGSGGFVLGIGYKFSIMFLGVGSLGSLLGDFIFY